jgi:ribosomal protein S18 acetylase RimI-like enzyme
MLIRPLTRGDDLHGAGEIVRRAYFDLDGYPHDPHYDEIIADVSGRIDDTLVLGAFVSDRLVGCLTYVDSVDNVHAHHHDQGAASFRYFGIDPEMQGSGVGEAMVRWVIERARHDDKQRILIHTVTMMHAAMHLYERLGFVRVSEQDFYWDDVKSLAYVLTL